MKKNKLRNKKIQEEKKLNKIEKKKAKKTNEKKAQQQEETTETPIENDSTSKETIFFSKGKLKNLFKDGE